MARGKTGSGYVDFWDEMRRALSETHLQDEHLIKKELSDIYKEESADRLLQHEEAQLKLHSRNEDIDIEHQSRWSQLESFYEDALAAIENNNISSACWFFYWMGASAQELQSPTHEEQMLSYAARIQKLKSERPLQIKVKKQKSAKHFVQSIAQEQWKTKKYRLTEMANYVWKILIDSGDIEKFTELPNDANGLKSWLREISPDFAKKRGR
jgi:hypothetical protein